MWQFRSNTGGYWEHLGLKEWLDQRMAGAASAEIYGEKGKGAGEGKAFLQAA